MSLARERGEEYAAALALFFFRKTRRAAHLATCPEVIVSAPDAQDGEFGCDTGCEYVRLTALLTCPHEAEAFEYGEFGDIADLMAEFEKYGP